MKKTLSFFLLILTALTTMAQVSTSPSPLRSSDLKGTIVLTFDPTQGNGGMKTATKCYCHTGLITTASKNDGDWKNVIGSWRGANQPQLTSTADGKWQLTINNVYSFYGVSESTEIVKFAFVFHDGPGGSKEGKTKENSDIFVSIEGVDSEIGIWRGFKADACLSATRPAGVDCGIYYGTDGTSVTLCTYAASKTAPANHVFLIGDMTNWKLDNKYQLKRDGNYFWITLTGLTAGKEYAFQYAVERADGKHVQISDLYSEKVLHPDDKYEPKTVDPTLKSYPTSGADGGYVTVIQPGRNAYAYNWQHDHFVRPNKNNLVIYELWVYDYTKERSLAGLLKRLDYIQNLGVNAVELMPICEYEGNLSWGYNPTHYFALDKAIGTPVQLKKLVDECHRRGMAVILDMVFNHTNGLNPMDKLYPYGQDLSSNPWFNVSAPHEGSVGEDWNHDFAPAREMFARSLKYWLTEYHVDGFRMDISHGFCGPNCSQLFNNLKYYHSAIKSVDPTAYFIQEYWGSSPTQQQLISEGMQCWTGQGVSDAYGQLAMGWIGEATSDNISDANRDGFVAYNESHDEERNFYKAKMWGNGSLKNDEAARLARVPAVMAFNTLLNGSHMIWQYGEMGYDWSIDNNGRTGTKPRCESWITTPVTNRMEAYQKTAQIIQLRTRLLPDVFAGNPTTQNLYSGNVRTVQWGSRVYVAANFSATTTEAVSLPSGTWYDYLNSARKFNASTLVLNPGEVRVLTGTAVQAPEIPMMYDFSTGLIHTFGSCSLSAKAQKRIEDNQLVIVLDGKKYDVSGRLIR